MQEKALGAWNAFGPTSYGRDAHHHLAVGGGPEPRVAGPQLAEDVEDGVAAVVVEDSP